MSTGHATQDAPSGIGTKRLDWLEEVDPADRVNFASRGANMDLSAVLIQCTRALIEEMRIEFWKLLDAAQQVADRNPIEYEIRHEATKRGFPSDAPTIKALFFLIEQLEPAP